MESTSHQTIRFCALPCFFAVLNACIIRHGQARAATSAPDEAATTVGTPVIIDVIANDTGDTDIVFANDTTANRVCLGDGTGVFSCADVSPDIYNSKSVALGDNELPRSKLRGINRKKPIERRNKLRGI